MIFIPEYQYNESYTNPALKYHILGENKIFRSIILDYLSKPINPTFYIVNFTGILMSLIGLFLVEKRSAIEPLFIHYWSAMDPLLIRYFIGLKSKSDQHVYCI